MSKILASFGQFVEEFVVNELFHLLPDIVLHLAIIITLSLQL